MQRSRSSIKAPGEDGLVSGKPKKKKKKNRYIFLKILILILICTIVYMTSALYGYRYIVEGTKQAEEIISESEGDIFTIPSGARTTNIADELKKQGYIKNTTIYRILSKLMGFDNAYKAGKYIITKDMNYYALMLRLTGEALKNPTKDILIPEGRTLLETVEILEGQGYIDKEKFFRIASQKLEQYKFLESVKESDARKYPLEGYLYPDTYRMDEGWTEEQLILRMLDQFNRIFTQEYYDRAQELGMTVDEVVTLASLIEAEARYPADYKKISSVFHNRLKKGMKLESDVTVQYARVYAGLGRTSVVLYKDLEIDSPYNTYIHEGLPPGPVCSPRKDAIEAALYPEKTNYLFFFATPDGTNIYNETYEKHIADQKKYGVSGQQ